jgi:hypothetical protein
VIVPVAGVVADPANVYVKVVALASEAMANVPLYSVCVAPEMTTGIPTTMPANSTPRCPWRSWRMTVRALTLDTSLLL